jgi:hypothetical protein
MAHLLVSAHQSAPAHLAFVASTGPPGAFFLRQDAQGTAAHPATPPCLMPSMATLLHSDGAELKRRSTAITLLHQLGAR